MENFKIDREKKSFVFDDGEVIPIPQDKVKQVLRTKAGQKSKQEAIEKWQEFQGKVPIGETGHALVSSASEGVFGNIGDTLANYGVSGIKAFQTGEGQEGLGYVDRVLDHFYAMQEGRKEYLGGLQEKNPTASTVGKGVGIGAELGLLYGIPGAAAFPLMGAGHSETSFLEPVEKSKEVTKDFLTGAVLDKFFGGLGKIAGARGAQRAEAEGIKAIEEGNVRAAETASKATEAEQLRFRNESAAREAQVAGMPAAQQAENQAFQQATDTSLQRISQTLGHQNLPKEALGVEEFINAAVETSSHAATKEGNYVSRFLKSIFKGDTNGRFTGASLGRAVQALDEGIIKSVGAARKLLTEYKTFLTQTLPERLASSHVYDRWVPRILRDSQPIEREMTQLFQSYQPANEVLIHRLGGDYVQKFNQAARKAVDDVLKRFKHNFNSLDPAVLEAEISYAVRNSQAYQKVQGRINSMFTDPAIAKAVPQYGTLKNSVEAYPDIIAQRVSANYQRFQPDIMAEFATKEGVTSSALSRVPTSNTVLPPPAPVAPANVIQPNITPVPQPAPVSGIYGSLAQGLESVRNGGAQAAISTAKANVPGMAMAKMAGIPLGKAAIGAAGLATGARALTSPTVAGQVLRGGMEQGARGAFVFVNQLAEKYPSFHDGILEDPIERRSLTKEIENEPQMTLEQKAIFQSKINRGKPLDQKL